MIDTGFTALAGRETAKSDLEALSLLNAVRRFRPSDPDFPTTKAMQELLVRRGLVELKESDSVAPRPAPMARKPELDGAFEGIPLPQVAERIGATVEWVQGQLVGVRERKKSYVTYDGQAFISERFLERLGAKFREEARRLACTNFFTSEWLGASEATAEAGISLPTLSKWGTSGEVIREQTHAGWRYNRQSLRAYCRIHWAKRGRGSVAERPDWLAAELDEGVSAPAT